MRRGILRITIRTGEGREPQEILFFHALPHQSTLRYISRTDLACSGSTEDRSVSGESLNGDERKDGEEKRQKGLHHGILFDGKGLSFDAALLAGVIFRCSLVDSWHWLQKRVVA